MLLLPQSTLAVSGSETCKLYVNDTTALGHLNTGSDSQIVQSLQLGEGKVHGSPVALGNMVYVWAAGDTLRSYQVTGGQLMPAQVGPTALSTGQPGGELSLSANGATPGTGILWVSQPLNGDASQATVPGILQAYDATNVTTELWDSLLASGDDCGSFAKSAPPTVVPEGLPTELRESGVRVWQEVTRGREPQARREHHLQPSFDTSVCETGPPGHDVCAARSLVECAPTRPRSAPFTDTVPV